MKETKELQKKSIDELASICFGETHINGSNVKWTEINKRGIWLYTNMGQEKRFFTKRDLISEIETKVKLNQI